MTLKNTSFSDQGRNFENSRKLFKHLDRLSEWAETGDTYPVLVAIDLSNACNNFCPACMGIRPDNKTIPYERILEIIRQLKEVGVKAIGFGGGGDPSVHKNLNEILRFVNECGMEVGMYSHCWKLSDKLMETIVTCCTYLRVSLDAGTPEIYKLTHGMEHDAFYKVLENVRKLIALKKQFDSKIVIGGGYLVGPHTIDDILPAVKLYKELGLSYIRIRPFFEGFGVMPLSEEEAGRVAVIIEECKKFEDENFSVTGQQTRMEWMTTGVKPARPYTKCNIIHFETIINAHQEVYPCCHLSGMKEYCYGSLKEMTFKELWHSQQRKEANARIDFKDCPNPCSLDTHNRVLWQIQQPVMHKNFL